MRPRLTETELAEAVGALCRRDPDLARVVSRFGRPPLWQREPGFATLVQIILEQQVSLASGRAAYARLVRAANGGTPERIGEANERALASAGLTRQKRTYVRALARAVVSNEFSLDRVGGLDDEAAHAELVKLRGIGPWTADIYLLMALGRPDIWPRHDLALAIAMREVKRLRTLPELTRQMQITDAWRPWRAVGARILWHHYLSTPRRPPALPGSAGRMASSSGRSRGTASAPSPPRPARVRRQDTKSAAVARP